MLNTFRWLCLVALLALSRAAPSQPAAPKLVGATPASAVQVVLEPRSAISVGDEGRWVLTLHTLAGAPVDPISVSFEAGMPSHGHGLPQVAVVSATSQPGRYEIYPVQFNMGGAWQLVVVLGMAHGVEEVRFDLEVASPVGSKQMDGFSAGEIAIMQSLTLDALGAQQHDSTNRFSGVAAAAALGRALFFDTKLSGRGDVACVSCHEPGRRFTDGRALAFGSRQLARNAPSLVGVSRAHWFYWDGRRDSLWAQALTPLETPGEMDSTRIDVVRYVTGNPAYRSSLAKLSGAALDFSSTSRFPPGAGPFADPAGRTAWATMSSSDHHAVNTTFADIGKLIAAFEETLQPEQTRFDSFVRAVTAGNQSAATELLSDAERAGLKLFLDPSRTQCLQCHNGPLLTNQGFHAIGSRTHPFDLGFQLGLQAAAIDPFNCTGAFSDERHDCRVARMSRADAGIYEGAFKVPSLRGLNLTAPYFHDGRFETLEEVLAFYQNPPSASAQELLPLRLEADELAQLISFLDTLNADGSVYSSIAR